MKTLKIKVYGRVQGVCFRANTKTFCNKRGFGGYVCNKDDGSAEIVVQGSGEDLKKFVDWVKRSPGISNVEKVDVREIKCKEFDSFEIEKVDGFFMDQGKALKNLIGKI